MPLRICLLLMCCALAEVGALAAPAQARPQSRQAGSPAAAPPAADSAPPKKQRRLALPQSNAQTIVDTNRVARLFCFGVQRSSNDLTLREIDTSLHFYYVDYPFFRQDVGAVFLGNLGSPAMYYDYFKRPQNHEFLFAQPYAPYFLTPDNVSHYNTTAPYSLLYYAWTMQRRTEEMQLRALHTQSITNEISFGVRFDNVGTKGIYQRQNTKVMGINVFGSYLGKYYSANAGFIYNRVRSQENGGLTDPSVIFDPNFERPEGVEVRLAQARSQMWQPTWYVSHSADFPLLYIGNDSVIFNIIKGKIGHSFELSSYSRLYTDTENADADSSFYSNFFLNRQQTRDSIALKKMENRFFVQLHPLRAYIFEQLTAGVGLRRYDAYMFAPQMYLTGGGSERLNSTFAYLSGSAWYRQYFLWRAYAESVVAGYCAGDFLLNADLKLSVFPVNEGIHLFARAELNSHRPSYFYQNYFSNHYQWNHAGGEERFGKITETKIEAAVSIPHTSTQAAFKYGLHSGYLYFDENRAPQQHGSILNIVAFTLDQNFKLWHFHFNHRFLLQKSSDPEVLDLPLFSANVTYYFNYELVKRVLRMELGVDVQYCTQFRGYGYDPSLGMFHNSPQMQGGYLWADAFVALHWKKATPFVKWEHANQNLWEQPNGYYSAINHPRNLRVFKFGLSWKFYD